MSQEDGDFSSNDSSDENKFQPQEFINTNKVPIAGVLIGLSCLGVGVFLYKDGYFEGGNKVEIIDTVEATKEVSNVLKEIIVEISGAVVKPGVYKLKEGDRIEDLLIISGGISGDADRSWFEKSINRAAKLTDGQKLYIYKIGETADKQSVSSSAGNSSGVKLYQESVAGATSGVVNINDASLQEIDQLPGIGQVYGQSIIDHRPYSTLEELVSKGAIKQNILDKIKYRISLY